MRFSNLLQQQKWCSLLPQSQIIESPLRLTSLEENETVSEEIDVNGAPGGEKGCVRLHRILRALLCQMHFVCAEITGVSHPTKHSRSQTPNTLSAGLKHLVFKADASAEIGKVAVPRATTRGRFQKQSMVRLYSRNKYTSGTKKNSFSVYSLISHP